MEILREWLPHDGLFWKPISMAYVLPLLILLVAACHRMMTPKRRPRRLPPSPRKLPIIGNIHQLGSLLHRSLCTLSRKHGPIMLLHLGQVPTLVISSSEAAREVMTTHDLAFSNRAFNAAADLLSYGSRGLVFVPYGEHWRQTRKAVMVHLLCPNKVKSFRKMREEDVAIMMKKIAQETSSSPTSAAAGVDMRNVFHCFSSALVTRLVMGRSTSARKEEDKMIRELTAGYSAFASAFRLDTLVPSLTWLCRLLGMDSRLLRFFKKWDALLDQVIDEHEQSRAREWNETAEEDFMDVLLSNHWNPATNFSISRNDVKAISMDIVGAGIDTTSTVLEWALAELVKNPEMLEKAGKEVREITGGKAMATEDDVARMRYLKAVIKEVLRLHPPGPLLVPRETTEDTKVLGYDIPRKTRVFFNAWAIARDPGNWEAPEAFRPERFLDREIDFRGNDFQFIPFGGGRRVCPAMNYAINGIELAIANLLNGFDWVLPGGARAEDWDMEESPGIVVRRKSCLHLVAIPRLPCVGM